MRNFSRLARREEKRNLRQAITWAILTVVLALGLLFLGIPALIKMAVFLGNLRASSQPVENSKILPPSPPILNPAPEATNSGQMKFSGLADPGTTVTIFLNGAEVKKIVTGSDGTFSFDDLILFSGENEVYTRTTDRSGNESAPSEKINVFFDNTPPSLEITQPKEKTSTSDISKTSIIGKTDLDASVTINDHLVIVDKGGVFQYSLVLSSGENNFKVVARDQAGNQMDQTFTINFSP